MNWKLNINYSLSQTSSNWERFADKLQTMLELANILEDDIYNVNQKAINISRDIEKSIKDKRRMIYPIVSIKKDTIIIENIAKDKPYIMMEISNNN